MSHRHLIFDSQDSVILVMIVDELAKTFPASSYDVSRDGETGIWAIYATIEPEKSVSIEAIQQAAQVASNIYKRAVSSAISQGKVKRALE